MKFTRSQRLTSVLGLTLDGGLLRAVQLARGKDAPEVVKTVAAPLTLDPFAAEAALAGREVRQHLDAAGARERNCVVGLPASWLMSQHIKLPDLPAADVESFLQLEAEKGFPSSPEQLQIATSTHRSAAGTYVTQLAVRKDQVERLLAVLKAAGLKPLSLSLGLAALPGVIGPAGNGRITLAVEPKAAALLLCAGGGIAAFRTSEATIESEVGERLANTNAIARELRITVAQLSSDLRPELKQLHLVGESTLVSQLAESLAVWAASSDLSLVSHGSAEGELAAAEAEHLARRWFETGLSRLEFMPPRPSRWNQLVARYNSKRLTTVGFGVAVAAALVMFAFAIQEYRAWSLRKEWATMKPQVDSLEATQARIREYRSWYDESFHNLTILRSVTEAFPDNGSVTAKSFEIHNLSAVTVSGTTRDNTALLKTLDQLRKTRDVQGLKVDQIRGKVPQEFTFNFRWGGNSGI